MSLSHDKMGAKSKIIHHDKCFKFTQCHVYLSSLYKDRKHRHLSIYLLCCFDRYSVQMSINTVILHKDYERLLEAGQIPCELYPLESIKYTTRTKRQNLSLASNNNLNAHSLNITASDGFVCVTNKRFMYITFSKGDIDTFLFEFAQAPLLQFSHRLVSPWFGANYWEFLFQSKKQASSGFPEDQWFKGTVKFNDGGLFEFIEVINNILNDIVNNSHIDDELPLYSI